MGSTSCEHVKSNVFSPLSLSLFPYHLFYNTNKFTGGVIWELYTVLFLSRHCASELHPSWQSERYFHAWSPSSTSHEFTFPIIIIYIFRNLHPISRNLCLILYICVCVCRYNFKIISLEEAETNYTYISLCVAGRFSCIINPVRRVLSTFLK